MSWFTARTHYFLGCPLVLQNAAWKKGMVFSVNIDYLDFGIVVKLWLVDVIWYNKVLSACCNWDSSSCCPWHTNILKKCKYWPNSRLSHEYKDDKQHIELLEVSWECSHLYSLLETKFSPWTSITNRSNWFLLEPMKRVHQRNQPWFDKSLWSLQNGGLELGPGMERWLCKKPTSCLEIPWRPS